jgi:hypothetical protein
MDTFLVENVRCAMRAGLGSASPVWLEIDRLTAAALLEARATRGEPQR